jgi:membrane protein
MSGTTMLMQPLTIACDENEDCGIVRFFFTAAALTAGLIQSGLLSLFLVTVSPAFLDRLPFPGLSREAVFLRRLVLAGRAVAAPGDCLSLRTCRYRNRSHWISPGAIAAMLFWIVGSAGFSFYVSRFGSYDKIYGSIGAVVILLMWSTGLWEPKNSASIRWRLFGIELSSSQETSGKSAATSGDFVASKLI